MNKVWYVLKLEAVEWDGGETVHNEKEQITRTCNNINEFHKANTEKNS